MRVAIFGPSVISDWQAPRVPFLRGIASELRARGHEVILHEPRSSLNLACLIQDHGYDAVEEFRIFFPELDVRRYGTRCRSTWMRSLPAWTRYWCSRAASRSCWRSLRRGGPAGASAFISG
jgi:hypothetical protein